MAEVSAAGRTEDLGADHAVAPVALLLDRGLACGGEEGGPAAARVVLRVRLEEQRAAAGAMVGARVEDVVVLTGECRFGALLAEHLVFLGCQLVSPFGVGLLDSIHGVNGTNEG